MKNTGKRFEENFKKSVPDNVYYYRFRDSGTSFGKGEFTRFTITNVADAMLFDGKTLFLCELKHHFGKSIPFSAIEGNKTKEKQIKDLLEASKFQNIKCLLIIYLSDCEECFALDVNKYLKFKQTYDRKSIDLDYLKDNAVSLKTIKLRTNIRLDLSPLFE